MNEAASIRRYAVSARSTDVFGRVLCTARNHHFVCDGPEQNGCPGEETTPAELFLSGIASCAVELIQALARRDAVPLRAVRTAVGGTIDPDRQVHPDHTLFTEVRVRIEMDGVTPQQAEALAESFAGR